MANITRKNLKLFAENATATALQIFGSRAATTPALNPDPEVLQNLTAYLEGLDSADFTSGSDKGIPSKELNALFYIINYHLKYILQNIII